MRFLLRILGLLVLLVSVVCFAGCMAGIVGIWKVHEELSERTRKISGRIDAGLERASVANRDVARALQKARDELVKVNKEVNEKAPRRSGILRRLVWQEVGPKLNELGGRLATVSDAAVVVASLLHSLQELPFRQPSRIDTERMERWTDRSSQLLVSLRKLQATVGADDGAVTDKDVADSANAVEVLLGTCQTTVDDWQSDLDTMRSELSHLEAEILAWMTLITIIVSVTCVWVALSQICLFAHALRWCFGRRADQAKA